MTRYVWEEEKDSKQSSHFTTAGTPGSMKALFPLWKLMFKLSPGYFSTSKKSLLGG